MFKDEAYVSGPVYQLRSSLDRNFWHTSGGAQNAIAFGIMDDFGNIVSTFKRPFNKDIK